VHIIEADMLAGETGKKHLLCDKAAKVAVNIELSFFEQLWLRMLKRCVKPAYDINVKNYSGVR